MRAQLQAALHQLEQSSLQAGAQDALQEQLNTMQRTLNDQTHVAAQHAAEMQARLDATLQSSEQGSAALQKHIRLLQDQLQVRASVNQDSQTVDKVDHLNTGCGV